MSYSIFNEQLRVLQANSIDAIKGIVEKFKYQEINISASDFSEPPLYGSPSKGDVISKIYEDCVVIDDGSNGFNVDFWDLDVNTLVELLGIAETEAEFNPSN